MGSRSGRATENSAAELARYVRAAFEAISDGLTVERTLLLGQVAPPPPPSGHDPTMPPLDHPSIYHPRMISTATTTISTTITTIRH